MAKRVWGKLMSLRGEVDEPIDETVTDYLLGLIEVRMLWPAPGLLPRFLVDCDTVREGEKPAGS